MVRRYISVVSTRSFTSYPFVYTNSTQARRYTRLPVHSITPQRDLVGTQPAKARAHAIFLLHDNGERGLSLPAYRCDHGHCILGAARAHRTGRRGHSRLVGSVPGLHLDTPAPHEARAPETDHGADS